MGGAANNGDHVVQVLLEVYPRSDSGDLGPRVAVPEEFRRRASEVADSIVDVADQIRSRLEVLLKRPTSANWGVGCIEIEFEIAVQAETGVIIAKAKAGGTFSVRLKLEAPQEPR